MSSDIENIRVLLNEMRHELLMKQNVVATGIGFKRTSGKDTSELAIICSVEIKKALSRLSKRDLVPAMIGQVPTDVRPSGIIRAHQSQTDRLRPAPGGCSIGQYQITAGTLGCLVKKNGSIFILSNNHVLANSNEATYGDPILQPGPYDGGSEDYDRLANLNEFIPIEFESVEQPDCNIVNSIAFLLNKSASILGSSVRLKPYRQQTSENLVDCALASPMVDSDVSNEILQIGKISGTAEGELGMKIKKSGRTTGLTSGVIQQIDVSARVSYGSNKTALFTDQLMAGAMSQGGDSGSAVLSESNKLVGLLFAGSDSTTIINRIQNVFTELKVSLV